MVVQSRVMPGNVEPGKSSLESSPIRQWPACGPIYFLNFTAYFFKKINGADDASSTPCIRKKDLTCHLYQQTTRCLFILESSYYGGQKNRVLCFLFKNSFLTHFPLKTLKKHPRDLVKFIHSHEKRKKTT